ncbi:signal peptidase I [Microbacterium aurugineum]|uniref:signal peptidase I n=1 Tax=Microbacterium aurugineum TaxID=2851642 RepID=UPI0020C0EACB|nr:signal peptidase I [Microbacterium aurugineum]MCK8475680.1 signal peptidase I [Microbacterium aurugineum]
MTTLTIPVAPPHPTGILRRAVDLVSRGIGMLVLVGLLLVAGATIAVPALLGATPLAVLTSSMEPTYPPGTLIVVQPTPADDIHVGDVITFQLHSGKPAVVTHRVIEVAVNAAGEHVFRTQGDNNPDADVQAVREVQLKGKLLYAVPGLGWVQNILNGEVRALLIPLIAGGLFLYATITVVRAVAERRRGRDADEATDASGSRRNRRTS